MLHRHENAQNTNWGSMGWVGQQVLGWEGTGWEQHWGGQVGLGGVGVVGWVGVEGWERTHLFLSHTVCMGWVENGAPTPRVFVCCLSAHLQQ